MSSPTRTLIRLEARLLWRTATPWIVAALFIVTSVAAVANGRLQWRRHHDAATRAWQQQSQQYRAVAADIARVEQQRAAASIPKELLQPGLSSPAAVEARLLNFRAALPPLSTGILNTGALQALPQRYELRSGGGARYWPFGRTVGDRILSGFGPEQPLENPSATVVGAFDLAFVTVYVYPLLILALAYNVVSADREAGILSLVAAQPISFRRWLAAKAIVRLGVVALGLLPSIVVTAAAIPQWSSDVALRLMLWTVAVVIYCLLWLGTALAISARTASASLSALVCAAGWLVVVIVMPALASVLGPFLAPAATRIAYVNEERAASLDINPGIDDAIASINQQVRMRLAGAKPPADRDHPSFTDPIAVQVGADLLASLPNPPWSSVMPAAHLSRAFAAARRTLVEQRLAHVLSALDRQERREAAFFAVARYLSPTLLMQSVVDTLAGTDGDRRIRFLERLDDHVRESESFFTHRILVNKNVRSEDFQTLAPFQFREQEAVWLPARMAPALVGLLAMCVWAMCVVAMAARRWH